MSNQLKLLVIQKKNKKKIKPISKFNKFIEEIKSKEMEKLKSPIKGQLFVYLDDFNNYFFYQFTGKSWIEIK
jgi:chromosomal replication initiation ATPase DnaA